MVLKDETSSEKRGMPYMYIMLPYSHNPVFPQLVIQGSPADAEYTGGKGAVVAGLPKYPKYLLLLLFRTDSHVSQFHVLIQIQFLCGYPPLPGKHDGTPDGVLQLADIPRPAVLP